MTKQEVLEIFAKWRGFIPPDAVCKQLRGFHHRSSIYSYLFRLHQQGLLYRQVVHGRIAYQISQRGFERLNFFRSKQGLPSQEIPYAGAIGESQRK
jgi:DNA-binding PadR family transcriptional regulator